MTRTLKTPLIPVDTRQRTMQNPIYIGLKGDKRLRIWRKHSESLDRCLPVGNPKGCRQPN